MELKLEFEELYISGTGDIELQSKTVVPTKVEQVIIADEDYTALSKVIIEAIPNEYQDITGVTATESEVRSGYSFVNSQGEMVNGEMQENEPALVNLTKELTEYEIPQGYHNGQGKVFIETEEKAVVPTKETQKITASENKVLSKVTVLPIPEDYVNKNEVQKPTLNAPSISFSSSTTIRVNDYKNGEFAQEYGLYVNGIKIANSSSPYISLDGYEITDTDEISVEACSSLFNNSPLSNVVTFQEVLYGTAGLEYTANNNGGIFTGIGSVIGSDIIIAAYYQEREVTLIYYNALANCANKTIRLPDTLQYFASQQSASFTNATIVFGASTRMQIERLVLKNSAIFDFRNIKVIPTLIETIGNTDFAFAIINDDVYDKWITSTNWVSLPQGKFIRASDYEAKQGGTV